VRAGGEQATDVTGQAGEPRARESRPEFGGGLRHPRRDVGGRLPLAALQLEQAGARGDAVQGHDVVGVHSGHQGETLDLGQGQPALDQLARGLVLQLGDDLDHGHGGGEGALGGEGVDGGGVDLGGGVVRRRPRLGELLERGQA
jgi:hypothetical protein